MSFEEEGLFITQSTFSEENVDTDEVLSNALSLEMEENNAPDLTIKTAAFSDISDEEMEEVTQEVDRLERNTVNVHQQRIILVTDVEAYCWTAPGIESVPQGYSKETYTPSNVIIENPGRGYIEEYHVHANNFQRLSEFQLDALRVSTGTTLVMRHYVLDGFVNSIISDDFLSNVKKDLSTVLDSGFMVVLRFSYTVTSKETPPFGDASKQMVKIHIAQLREIFRYFESVIIAVQAGFIGIWGEWYYTDHFGFDTLTTKNWEDRREIVQALLEAVPESVPLQLRTPDFKRTMFGQAPTTYRDLYIRKAKSRIGAHNDCFLAGPDDRGTYKNKMVEYAYLQNDNKFVIVGGETCAASNTSRHLCPTALKELEDLHYTFMARTYNLTVLNLWKSGGCYEEIRNKLGYRLSFQESIIPTTVRRGDTMSYYIVLVNSGYAAPPRSMNVFLVLLSDANIAYKVAVDADTRTWLPGDDIILSGAATIPIDMPKKSYGVAIAVGDKLFPDRSDYYIIIDSKNKTMQDQGLNFLNHVVEVIDKDESKEYGGNICPPLSAWKVPLVTKYPRILGDGRCFKSRLLNNDFEEGISGWKTADSGAVHLDDATQAEHGSEYIKITDGAVYQVLSFTKKPKELIKKMVLRGWSKHSGQVSSNSYQYSVYCDVYSVTGKSLYGLNEPFQSGGKGLAWHNATLQITVAEGIDHAYCYMRYYNQNKGFAYFDMMDVWILTGDAHFADCDMQ